MRVFIGLRKKLWAAGAVKVVGYAHGNAPAACRRILQLRDDFFSLRARLNPRHHHATRANIQYSRKRLEVYIGHARHGNNRTPPAAGYHFRQQSNIASAMLHVINHKLHAGCRQHRPNAGSKQLQHHLAEDHLAVTPAFSQ